MTVDEARKALKENIRLLGQAIIDREWIVDAHVDIDFSIDAFEQAIREDERKRFFYAHMVPLAETHHSLVENLRKMIDFKPIQEAK